MSLLTQLDIATLAQEERYRAQVEIIRQIATAKGFYEYFFQMLSRPEFKSRIEVFNYVNDLYFELFGEHKYSSYQSFLNSKK